VDPVGLHHPLSEFKEKVSKNIGRYGYAGDSNLIFNILKERKKFNLGLFNDICSTAEVT
jgi:hypothetical protein